MKRSLAWTQAVSGGVLLGVAGRRARRGSRVPAAAAAMRRLTTYFIIPIWIGGGFLDYIWHRRTHIETTSGLSESLCHTLMMAEAAPAVLAPLFLEVNAGLLAVMLGAAILHEVTVLWDLSFTAP